jgi:hypothetical protein
LNANGKAQANDFIAWAYGERNRKMLTIKVTAVTVTSDLSFVLDVDLRLVWYGGLAVNGTGIYSLLGTYSE